MSMSTTENYKTSDVFFAVALLQAYGFDSLSKIEIFDRQKQITLAIPTSDAESYYTDWKLCRLGTQDLRGYTILYTKLTRILKDLQRNDETVWCGHAWISGR